MIIRLAASLLLVIATMGCLGQTSANSASRVETSSSSSEAIKEFERTRAQFLIDGKRPAAIAGLQHVLVLDPHFASAWFDLGYINEIDKNWSEAKHCFNKYLEVAPSTPDAARAKNEVAVIERISDPAYRKNADYATAIQRARVFLQAKLFRETIAETSRAQLIDDSRWEAYFIACIAMSRQGKVAEANALHGLALDRVPASQRTDIEALLPSAKAGPKTTPPPF
jgi:tetratricopeptide (TPR) repeat protein